MKGKSIIVEEAENGKDKDFKDKEGKSNDKDKDFKDRDEKEKD
jgi:hypothetical protein